MKKLLLLCACFVTVFSTFSQTDDRKWNFGLHGGAVEYAGDRGDAYYRTNQAVYGFAGLSVSRYLSKHFDASIMFTRGELGYVDRNSKNAAQPNNFLVRVNSANLFLRGYFTKPSAIVRPYIFVGAGSIWYEKVYKIQNERFEFALPSGGVGFNFKMGPVV